MLSPSVKTNLPVLNCYTPAMVGDGHCDRLNATKIQITYDIKHHEVSLLVKSHQNTHNSGVFLNTKYM